ncbi:MAG: hypothetical protein V3V18_08840 [Methylococcales bacterium]
MLSLADERTASFRESLCNNKLISDRRLAMLLKKLSASMAVQANDIKGFISILVTADTGDVTKACVVHRITLFKQGVVIETASYINIVPNFIKWIDILSHNLYAKTFFH